MVWNFLKNKIFKKTRDEVVKEKIKAEVSETKDSGTLVQQIPAQQPIADVQKETKTEIKQKSPAEKTDEELAEDLNKISPEILSQAKTPQTRKLVIDVYRKMLIDGVDVNNEKEVKKWLKKHPEVAKGQDVQKVDTFRRETPKIGRNDPCPCGSGKKYKKCCVLKKK